MRLNALVLLSTFSERGTKCMMVLLCCRNKLRKSRSAISSADVSSEIYLGLEGEDLFNFTQCSNKITVAEVSALTGKVEQVEQFIREHVKQ